MCDVGCVCVCVYEVECVLQYVVHACMCDVGFV